MIVIASDDAHFSDQCRGSLEERFPLYEGHIRTMHALMSLLKHLQSPMDILLLDLTLLGEEAMSKITGLLELRPWLHMIIFVKEYDQREEISAILFGAKAYCLKSMDFAVLPKIISAVMQNEVWVDRLFVTRLLSEIRDISEAKHQEALHLDHHIKDLTPRENQIADLVGNGKTNRSIAETLGITERTVKAHLGTIFKKMCVRDRLQLAISLNRHHQIPGIWHSMLEETKPSENKK